MKLTLISPRLAIQKSDFLGTGVPYWPVELATLAAFTRLLGDDVFFLDLFGTNPRQLSDMGDHYLQGESVEFFLDNEDVKNCEAFILFAISYMSHSELLIIVAQLKKAFPRTPIALLENSQAVTAYSIQHVANEFLEAGADLLICGEPYFNWNDIKHQLKHLSSESLPRNLISKYSNHSVERITLKGASYPQPAWDLVNLQAYWDLPYSHGPKTKKFLPVLTSRGCPYPCDFCVVPETNNRQWRGNTPEQVVDELISLRDRFDVYDFQIEDLNPTVQRLRWERICELLIERQANIRFYFVSGTKSETLHINKIPLFAEAGCKFISISPESGSKDLMKVVGKYFNYQHGLELISACKSSGIRTQACLLVGHPAENEITHKASKDYLIKMMKAGLDEVAVFIVAPFAGSAIYAKNNIPLLDKSSLPSFSPKGRFGYGSLESRRKDLIRIFFFQKLKNGIELWLQIYRALFGVPQTKIENLPRRFIFINWLIFRYKFFKR